MVKCQILANILFDFFVFQNLQKRFCLQDFPGLQWTMPSDVTSTHQNYKVTCVYSVIIFSQITSRVYITQHKPVEALDCTRLQH